MIVVRSPNAAGWRCQRPQLISALGVCLLLRFAPSAQALQCQPSKMCICIGRQGSQTGDHLQPSGARPTHTRNVHAVHAAY